MEWGIVIGVVLLAAVLINAALAEKCLQLVVKPVKYTAEQVRAAEIENGFSDCIEAYEQKWERHPFTLDCGDAVLSGESIINPAPSGRNKVAIVCHGHTVNRYASIKYAHIFYRLGFHVVLFDERSFGDSTGAFCTLGQNEAQDLVRLIRFTRQTFGADCILGLHGESMGAATALLSLQQETPDFVVADCPFADSRLLFRQWIAKNLHLPSSLMLFFFQLLAHVQYHYDVKTVSPILAVQKKAVPICFMHGSADTLIPCEHSKMMYQGSTNGKSELHIFEGANHAQSIVFHRLEYERLMVRFLQQCRVLE